MTAIELWNKLGEAFDRVKNANSLKERRIALENAEYLAKVAKQMSNVGDLVIRADKLCGQTDRTNAIIGNQ